MAEREKVARGLELCAYDPDPGQELKEIRSCPECPYYRAGCSPQLIRDALDLLKEQEPRVNRLTERVEPKIARASVTGVAWAHWYKCGACGFAIDGGDKFCRHCGKGIEWEEDNDD